MTAYFSGDDGIFTDGLTQRVGILQKEKIYSAIRFEFRPMLAEVVEAFEANRDRKSENKPAEVVQGMAKLISEHLVKWSADRPITYENVRKLRYGLLGRMYVIMAGLAAPDEILDEQGNVIEEKPERVLEADEVLGKLQSDTV